MMIHKITDGTAAAKKRLRCVINDAIDQCTAMSADGATEHFQQNL